MNTGLFLQVDVCVLLALHLSFWVHLEVLEVMQGALWLCKTAGWLRALPGRRSVLTFRSVPHPRMGKAFGGRGERKGSMGHQYGQMKDTEQISWGSCKITSVPSYTTN